MSSDAGADSGAHLPHPLSGQLFASPVPPGMGWPEDPGGALSPVAHSSADVQAMAARLETVAEIEASVSVCRACPRLVAWRELVAVTKRRSYAGEPYWGRPIAGWGSEAPRVLIVGLAPAAHGGNRTGRIFTGDRSGDWLFASLHRVGLATQPTSVHAGDGQQLVEARMVAAVRCAPPDNKPNPEERDACAPWLDAELAKVLPSARAVVCLGSFAWGVVWRALARQGLAVPRPRPGFGHHVKVQLHTIATAGADDVHTTAPASLTVLGCYHPSQQNTFTGKLTEPMLDAVLADAAAC
ncbi:MAG: uracil-DNA glycosylase [Nocardioidaceae bacterium]|nr:uracil-DNA glycosylase [Nocardioidaceae bacterium]